MAWTNEQMDAIYKDGTNIIVSAGAGSGKTAVLSERVLKKIENKVSIDTLLILTFTKLAAGEMKDRIRKKIKEGNFIDQLNKLDNAYITTFDSFALSIVKKYHYTVGVSNKVNIIDENTINNGLTHSENLMPLIDELLKRNNILLKDIDLIAVCVGPGSFTGIRIGISSIKAISEVYNIPIASVTSLEVLAEASEKSQTSGAHSVWKDVYVFQHFSMNRFSIDLNSFMDKKKNLSLGEAIHELGKIHKEEIMESKI